MKRIVIIGGGISGLAAAHRLTELAKANQTPLEIILLEANDRLGGTIQTEHRDGFLLERRPDSFISEKPEPGALEPRLCIEARLLQTNKPYRRSFIVRNGTLRKVPEGFQLLVPSRLWPFLATDIFSFAGKLRMAGDLFLPRSSINGSDEESLARFVTRRLGKEALERMAQPMVGGIYTADPSRLSLRATLPRFLEMEREHRSIILAMFRKRSQATSSGVSGARYSLFLSFDYGMQVLVDELTRNILNAGAELRLKTKVDLLSLVPQADKGLHSWTVTTTTGDAVRTDAVCLAVPGHAAALLVRPINHQLAQHLEEIEYASTATINFAYRRADIQHPLDGFGFVVPIIEKRSLIACTFSSVKFPRRAPDDYVLLRAFVGGALQKKMFELDEPEMVQRVKADLNALLGISGEPMFVETAKWSRSMPQYEVGHLQRVTAIENDLEELPTLGLCGNSHRGAGIPDCIRSGEIAAQRLFDLVLTSTTKGVTP